MEGGLRVHEVDLRQSLPTVLKAIEDKFKKLDASLAEIVAEVRRLGCGERQECEALKACVAGRCQGTEALKACVARACQGTEALKAEVANVCQGTEALRMDNLRNWSKAETRVGRLEADLEAARLARQEGSAEMAQVQIRQAQLEQRIFQLEAEVLRLAREATQPPLQPIISREDVDGLAAHVWGKIQAQVTEEVGDCARWHRETYDEPWKKSVQAQLMDLLRLDTEPEQEHPRTPPVVIPPEALKEPRPPLPMESSSTEAEPEPQVPRGRPVRRGPGLARAQGPELKPGRSEAFKRLDALYAKCQESKGASPKTTCPPKTPAVRSEESESSSGRRVPTQSTLRSSRTSATKTTEAQRAAVKRLRAIGCDLKPPGYESEDSPPSNVRMVRWGGQGLTMGHCCSRCWPPELPPSLVGRRPTGRHSPRTGPCIGTSSWRPRGETLQMFSFSRF